jgi:hypothetical protein
LPVLNWTYNHDNSECPRSLCEGLKTGQILGNKFYHLGGEDQSNSLDRGQRCVPIRGHFMRRWLHPLFVFSWYWVNFILIVK